MTILAERMLELMSDCNYSVADVATAINANKSVVYRYLRSERSPRLDILVKLADLFCCTTDFLVGLDSENFSKQFNKPPNFKLRFEHLIEQFGVSKYKLQKDTKISESIIFCWLNGQTQPNLDNLIKLATYFNCTLDYLIGREV